MIVACVGPSPRVWGELRLSQSKETRWRTIPTRVGRTLSAPPAHPPRADHPHACGENVALAYYLPYNVGPSPRVWGEHCNPCQKIHRIRTIPTRVGRTKDATPCAPAAPDHPHACGENHAPVRNRRRFSGPSPRVWGERMRPRCPHSARRTIPTRVGRTEGSGLT